MPLRPTRALIALLILWTLMGLAGSLHPGVSVGWGILGGALAFLALLDALRQAARVRCTSSAVHRIV